MNDEQVNKSTKNFYFLIQIDPFYNFQEDLSRLRVFVLMPVPAVSACLFCRWSRVRFIFQLTTILSPV
jgi:hypothetical protein